MREAIDYAAAKRRAGARRKKHFQMRFYLHESGPVLAQRLFETLLFFFLCLSECFRLPSPFAACALSAYLLARRRLFCPLLGVAASLGVRLLWGVDADPWLYAGCAALALARFYPPGSVWSASAYTALALAPRLAAQLFAPTTLQDLILSVLSLLVGVLCTPALCHAVAFLKHRQKRARIDDLLCCLVLCAALITGAGGVRIGPVNLGFLFTGVGILLCAAIGGCGASVAAGIIGGIALSLCGHPDGYVVCFAFSGIVCGLFYGRRRGVLCLIYLLCCAFTSFAVRFTFDPSFLSAAAASCALFLLLPRRGVAAAYSFSRSLSPDTLDNASAYAQVMRTQWTANIARLAQLLPEVRMPAPDEEERLEDIVERMCARCERASVCWHERAPESKALLRAYFIDGDRSARMANCPLLEAWPALALDEERSQQQRALRCAYAQREREATRTHLSAIAQAMARVAPEGGLCDRDDELLWGEAAFLLRQMQIAGRLLFALRVSRHICVAVRYEAHLTRSRQLERYGEELSRLLETPLRITRRSMDIVFFEETPPLAVECYHLSASSGTGNGVNGDSLLTRGAPGGMEIAMLSDGMGHGEQAHLESEKTLELLSLCLDSGYPVSAALDAINCIMLSSTDGEQYATVDLCVSDLWRGTATLDKLGACPSILLSGGVMRVLESSALPLGILPGVKSSTHTFPIGEGDVLIQFTDGLSDACGGMRALEKQIDLLMRDGLHRSPETICTALMSAAMRRSGGSPQDDVTVLCTRFKRQAKSGKESFHEERRKSG